MLVAVASKDGQKVSGHIGKCADLLLYDIAYEMDEADDQQAQPVLKKVGQMRLDKEFIFHHYCDEKEYPLVECKAVIGASAGDSFVAKMATRGIEAVLTSEADPETAATNYALDRLPPPKPRPIGGLICKLHDAISSHK
jgi:predicted Fe-Mo cluster-binding NifX family protein